MKSKLNFSGQMSLFDLFQNDAVPIEELQEKSVTNQHNLDEVADIIDSAAKDESVQRSVLKEDMLAIGDIIWSCYGDYEGTREAKAYIITDITNKGYMAQILGQEEQAKKLSLTLKSEGIAWARTRTDAEKIKL